MALVTIDVTGIEELRKKLDPALYQAAMRASLAGGAEILRNAIATYPPASAANVAPGINGYSWYERGFGTRTITGRAYATSEVLGRSWTTKITNKEAVVGSKVSYGPFVQDRERQAPFHKARGWTTIQDVVEKKGPDVIKLFDQVFAKAVKGQQP